MARTCKPSGPPFHRNVATSASWTCLASTGGTPWPDPKCSACAQRHDTSGSRTRQAPPTPPPSRAHARHTQPRCHGNGPRTWARNATSNSGSVGPLPLPGASPPRAGTHADSAVTTSCTCAVNWSIPVADCLRSGTISVRTNSAGRGTHTCTCEHGHATRHVTVRAAPRRWQPLRTLNFRHRPQL